MIDQSIVETTLTGFTRAITRYKQGVETVRRNAEAETRLWQSINDLKLAVNSLEITLGVHPRAKGKAGVDEDREKCEAALRNARGNLDIAQKNLAEMQAVNREDRATVIDAHGGLRRGLDELEATFRASDGLEAALAHIQELRRRLMEECLE